MVEIRRAGPEDIAAVTALSLMLWPDSCYEEREKEFVELLNDRECAVFICSEGGIDTGLPRSSFGTTMLRAQIAALLDIWKVYSSGKKAEEKAQPESFWRAARTGRPVRGAGNLPATVNCPTKTASASI